MGDTHNTALLHATQRTEPHPHPPPQRPATAGTQRSSHGRSAPRRRGSASSLVPVHLLGSGGGGGGGGGAESSSQHGGAEYVSRVTIGKASYGLAMMRVAALRDSLQAHLACLRVVEAAVAVAAEGKPAGLGNIDRTLLALLNATIGDADGELPSAAVSNAETLFLMLQAS